jgi:hypothetical protein
VSAQKSNQKKGSHNVKPGGKNDHVQLDLSSTFRDNAVFRKGSDAVVDELYVVLVQRV